MSAQLQLGRAPGIDDKKFLQLHRRFSVRFRVSTLIMYIEPIFSSFYTKTNLNLDNKLIVDWLNSQKREKEISDKIELYKYKDAYNILESQTPLTPLYQYTENCFNEVHKQIGLSNKYEHKINESWANMGACKRTEVPHRHVLADFVAVYFLEFVEGSGALKLLNPVASTEYVFPSSPAHSKVDYFNMFTSQNWKIEANVGDLVIFPSWLLHYVDNENSNITRTTIAMNSRMQLRSEKN